MSVYSVDWSVGNSRCAQAIGWRSIVSWRLTRKKLVAAGRRDRSVARLSSGLISGRLVGSRLIGSVLIGVSESLAGGNDVAGEIAQHIVDEEQTHRAV